MKKFISLLVLVVFGLLLLPLREASAVEVNNLYIQRQICMEKNIVASYMW
jgi:hypothetical protein